MQYRLREKIGRALEVSGKNLRYWVRRNYLRNDIDKFIFAHKKLSKEQIKQIDSFWKPYTKHICYKWHEFFYSITGVFDPRYIPEDLMLTDIEGCLNDWSAAHGVDNKNYYEFYFPEIKHPKVAFRRMRGILHLGDYRVCSLEEALAAAESFKSLFIKRTVEIGNGSSICFWQPSDGKDALRRIISEHNEDIIAQEFVEQHRELDAFNPSSVNSVRVVTLIIDNQVTFLCAYFRVGQKGTRIDNVCAGGMCSAVSEDGWLCGYAYDKRAQKQLVSPTGKSFSNFRIPNWDNLLQTVKKMHQKFGNFRIVSWDIAVDKQGDPVFIEMNLKYGAMEYHQLFKGPLFGDKTEQILDEVYRRGQ